MLGGSLAVGGSCSSDIRDRDLRPITLAEVRSASQGDESRRIVIMDARAPQEFERAHIPGARNVTINDVPKEGPKRREWSDASLIIVYAANSGSAESVALARRLLTAGYKKVRLYRGGLAEWTSSGLPVEPE